MQNIHRTAVGIDLGAKYTGVVIADTTPGAALRREDLTAFTIVMPDADKMVLAQAQRTATRHRLRGKKRFNLARRLAKLVIEARLAAEGVVLEKNEHRRMMEAVNGLLRRRGYSRVESEVDLSLLEDVDPQIFAECDAIKSFFPEVARQLLDQWEELTNDMGRVRDLDLVLQGLTKKDIKAALQAQDLDKETLKLATDAVDAVKGAAHDLVTQQLMGHKPRADYLKNLFSDLQRGDSRLAKVIAAFGGVERFHHVIGNISNLQLRAERWYFNAPHMVKGDCWEPQRLKQSLVRAFKYFHPAQEGDEKKRLADLVRELEASEDILEALCTIDPQRTIPPYEDQNNRRPPVDQTLYLSPEKLNAQLGEAWIGWAKSFAKADPRLEEGLDEILALTDRVSRIARDGRQPLPVLQYRFAYILQRVLDRSRLLDPCAIRAQAHGAVLGTARNKLEEVIGSQHADRFLAFAAGYYDEADSAKVGLWMPQTSQYLERSDLHPPMKKKILPMLVGNVLQQTPAKGERFMAVVWDAKVGGRSTVRSVCAAIEKVRKDNGGDFNRLYQRALLRKKLGQKLTAEDKAFVAVSEKVEAAAFVIARELGLTESEKAKFANPYSLAQCYTLIETERDGFTSVSVAAHHETNWRMQLTEGTDKDGAKVMCANCSRLPADAARPFDGVVRRVIDRKAWEIAKRMAKSVRQHVNFQQGMVEVPLFVEENRFEFSASLAELKHNALARKKMQEKSSVQTKRWMAKEDRIKAASRGVCPYTGKAIGVNGEIDHVIPRSLTKKSVGTVFNAEPNLIYVSQEGNQKKGDQAYRLRDLSPAYLTAVFRSASPVEVEQTIERTVADLQAHGRLRFFDLLSESEQDCVRHALFLEDFSPARLAVLEMLGNQRKARVNGTQMWLVRCLVQKLGEELSPWCEKTGNQLRFFVSAVSPEVSMRLRSALGEVNPAMKKPDVQPAASHTLDALCALAVGSDGFFADEPALAEAESLAAVYPASCDIVQIQRKPLEEKSQFGGAPLFKDGIYAEQYLPLFTLGGKVFAGYVSKPAEDGTMPGAVEVTGKEPQQLLEVLSPYFVRPFKGDAAKNETYRIDRLKAATLLVEAAHAVVSEEKLKVARLLDGLTFCTKRCTVVGAFWDSVKKALVAEAAALKADKFDVKLSLGVGRLWSLKGKLTLPVKKEWTALYEAVKSGLGPDGQEQQVRDLIDRSWRRPEKRRLQHVPVHRDLSLPVIDNPSGGFRFMRRTLDGRPVIQVQVPNSKLQGFASEGGVVDWGKAVLFERFRSPKITMFESRYFSETETTSMNEWRQILDGDVDIWLSPGSAVRFNARIEAPFESVIVWLKAGNPELTCTSFLELPGDLRVKDPKAFFAALPPEARGVLNQPRAYLYFEEVGARVRFWFTVASNNAGIKEAYNRAASTCGI